METPTAKNTTLAEKLVPSIEITAAMVSDLRPDLAAVAKAYAQAALDPYIVTVRPAVALALQSKDDSAALEIARLRAAIVRMKSYVVGDRTPYWRNDDATTATRMCLADLCDAALQTDGGKL